eukprot:5077037-Amphidinium_carterae.1
MMLSHAERTRYWRQVSEHLPYLLLELVAINDTTPQRLLLILYDCQECYPARKHTHITTQTRT